MKILCLFIAFSLTLATSNCWLLDASTIKVSNATDQPLYVALYYTRHTYGTRIAKPYEIDAYDSATIELPSARMLSSRVLIAATSRKDLPKLHRTHMVQSVTIGMFYPKDFTLAIHRKTQQPIIIETAHWKKAEHEHSFIPHTLSTTLPIEQQQFLSARIAHTHKAQNRYCGHTLSRPLRIGLCASGGGFRAMLATGGVMAGLESIGVLPLIHTCMGSSGSTWFLFPWALSQYTASSYSNMLTQWLRHGVLHHITAQYKDFARVTAEKKRFNLSISGIDFFGINLANTLLKPLHENHSALTMNDVARAANHSNHPLILASIVTRPHVSAPYEWIVTSPFCLQFLNSKLCIPPHLLGARFSKGVQKTEPPAASLGYYLGVFGSAPSTSIRDAIGRAPMHIQNIFNKLLPKDWFLSGWSNARITAATVANPHYKMNFPKLSSIGKLSLVDAVYINNLPLEPIILTAEKPYDLLIVLDHNQKRSMRLATFHKAYKAVSQSVPHIDEEAIATSPFSVHGTPEDGPVIIYCTVEGSDKYDPTFNPAADKTYGTTRLLYTPTNAQRLVDYMSYVITSNEDTIRTIIHTLARPYEIKDESAKKD